MSKRVEVRAGDEFFAYAGDLFKRRGKQTQEVYVGGKINVGYLEPDEDQLEGESILPHVAARAWIESLGGEWVEVGEEKKAEAVRLVYFAHKSGNVIVAVEGSKDELDFASAPLYRRITIEGAK